MDRRTPIATGPFNVAHAIHARGKSAYAVSFDEELFYGFHSDPLDAIRCEMSWAFEREEIDEDVAHVYVGRVVPFDLRNHVRLQTEGAIRQLVEQVGTGLPYEQAFGTLIENTDRSGLAEKVADAFAEWAHEHALVPNFFGVVDVTRYAVRFDAKAPESLVAKKEAA